MSAPVVHIHEQLFAVLAKIDNRLFVTNPPSGSDNSTWHCESGKQLWLHGEAALQTQSFRDAQVVIQLKIKKINEMPPVQLRSA